MRTIGIVALLACVGCPAAEGPPAEEPPAVSSIQVESKPPGAEVRLDGREMGITPVTLPGVVTGPHHVSIRLPGYEIFDRELGLAEEVFRMEAHLVPEPASMRIESDPAGASVRVDGESRGVTPLDIAGMEPGSHALRLELEGHAPWETEMDALPGARIRQWVALAPDPRRRWALDLMDDAERCLERGRPGGAWICLDDIPDDSRSLLTPEEAQRLGYLEGRVRGAVPAIEFALRFGEDPLRDRLGSPTGDPGKVACPADAPFVDYGIILRVASREPRHACLLQFKREAASAARIVPHEATETKETILLSSTEGGSRDLEFTDSTRSASDDVLFCLLILSSPPPEGALRALLEESVKGVGEEGWARWVVGKIKTCDWFQDRDGVLRSLLVRMEES